MILLSLLTCFSFLSAIALVCCFVAAALLNLNSTEKRMHVVVWMCTGANLHASMVPFAQAAQASIWDRIFNLVETATLPQLPQPPQAA